MRKPSEYMSKTFINDIYPAFASSLKAQRTREEYFAMICLYCDFLKKDFMEQTMSDALRYNRYLSNRVLNGSFSTTSMVTRIACYRKIEDYLRDTYGEDFCERCWGKIQMPALESSISEKQIPTVEDLDELLNLAKSEGLMWYVIISLVIKCALTASEIVNFKRENLISEHDNLYVYFPQKGNRNFQERRYLKMPDDMKELFVSYMATLDPGSEHFFFNKKGRPVSLKNIDDALARMYARSDHKRYTIKDIRTRGILEMLSATDNPQAVADYVGLSQLRMKTFVEAAGLIGDHKVAADYNNLIVKPYR